MSRSGGGNNDRDNNREGGSGNRGAFRTRVCRFWQRGHCKQGDRCTYAHGQDQVVGGGGSSNKGGNNNRGGGGGGRRGGRNKNREYVKKEIEMPERPENPHFPDPDEGLTQEEIVIKDKKEAERKAQQREFLKQFLTELQDDENVIAPSETPAILR